MVSAVPEHHPHVVHLAGKGALLLTGDIVAGRAQEERVIARDLSTDEENDE